MMTRTTLKALWVGGGGVARDMARRDAQSGRADRLRRSRQRPARDARGRALKI